MRRRIRSRTRRSSPSLREALAARRRAELERAVCLVGPHRDELELRIGGLPARGYASHGESWSLALALRLAAYQLLRAGGEDPVLMLDDVFAELDSGRRDRLAELVRDAEQVLVTAAVPAGCAGWPGRRQVPGRGRGDQQCLSKSLATRSAWPARRWPRPRRTPGPAGCGRPRSREGDRRADHGGERRAAGWTAQAGARSGDGVAGGPVPGPAQRGQRSGRRAPRYRALSRPRPGGLPPQPPRGDPQPLGAAINGLLDAEGWALAAATGSVFGRWAQIVGADLAAHTTPESLVRRRADRVADSTAWATQVRLLAAQLVRRLNSELGDGTVLRVKVRGPVTSTRKPGEWRVRGGRGPRDTYG